MNTKPKLRVVEVKYFPPGSSKFFVEEFFESRNRTWPLRSVPAAWIRHCIYGYGEFNSLEAAEDYLNKYVGSRKTGEEGVVLEN